MVNNNASAVMLGLAAIAAGKEVIVSRGEAVEIGGGFRIPDVLRQSGATLVEVGTTNRAYARDFEDAITENTGAILSVHASNFRVIGFTHAPTTAELVEVGDRNGVPVLHDLGSGCLLDTRPYGLAWEPRPQESVRAGVALGFFSGDKLLGGPQAGIIVGKREYVDIVSAHPLARAVRIDKMSMASLSATMLHYIRDDPTEKVPIWRMISAPLDELQGAGNGLATERGPLRQNSPIARRDRRRQPAGRDARVRRAAPGLRRAQSVRRIRPRKPAPVRPAHHRAHRGRRRSARRQNRPANSR